MGGLWAGGGGGGGGEQPLIFESEQAQDLFEGVESGIGDIGDVLGTPGSGGLFDEQLGIAEGQLGLQGQTTQLGEDAAAISRGNDPAFAQFRAAQLAQFGAQRGRAESNQAAQLARMGLTGSGAALNQAAQLNRQFNQESNLFTGGLGLSQLQRQDAARTQAGGLFGQAGTLGESAFNIQSGALGNLAIPPALMAALLAGTLPATQPPPPEPPPGPPPDPNRFDDEGE